MKPAITTACLLLTLSACSTPTNSNTLPNDSGQQQNLEKTQAIKVNFVGKVNGEKFACGESYNNIGTSNSSLTPRDFRFYVSNAHLVNTAGKQIPITLEQDGKWQVKNLGLIDFEDKSGDCSSGTSETRFTLTGTVPEGRYKGLTFDLGVPFDLNHQDVNKADSPLNLTSMFWVWRSGYKFLRADFSTTGQPQGYFVHLGSTGCEGMSNSGETDHSTHSIKAETASSEMVSMPPASCSNPNRPSISLPDFEVDKHTVVADLGHLLQDSNIDQNQPDSAAGCMSSPDDMDCTGIFNHLSLDFSEAKSNGQHFFSME